MRTPEISFYNHERRWFLFLILYLLIDLGRVQEIFPIASLRIGMVVTIVLVLFLFGSGRLVSSIRQQSKLILFFVLLLSFYVPVAINNFYAYIAFRTLFLMLPFLLSFIILVNSQSRLLIICKVNAALMLIGGGDTVFSTRGLGQEVFSKMKMIFVYFLCVIFLWYYLLLGRRRRNLKSFYGLRV